jgi:hypothetical protein
VLHSLEGKLVVHPQDPVRGQLGAVVAHDRLGLAAFMAPIELTGNPNAQNGGVGDERQALARAIVDHDEDAQSTAIDELIGNEAASSATADRGCGCSNHAPWWEGSGFVARLAPSRRG